MKKILFIIFTMFAFLNVVNAQGWQEEILLGDNIETEKRYRFYKEKEVGEYLSINSDHNYQYIDEDKFVLSDYSDYKLLCDQEEFDIEHSIKYTYKKLLPVKYIKIRNEDTDIIEINDILIIKDDNRVNYNKLSCSDCSNGYKSINPKGELILELFEEVQINDIDLEIIFNNSSKGLNHRLDYSYTDVFDNKNMVALIRSSTKVFNYHVNDTYYVYSNYTSDVYTDYNILENKYIKVLSKEEVCRSKEKLIYHYNIEKEYYDNNYYKDIKDLSLSFEDQLKYIKDEQDYKVFYRVIEENDDNLEEEFIVENNDYILENLELVKTGYEESKDFKYLKIYILVLVLLSFIFIKRIRRMSIKNNI